MYKKVFHALVLWSICLFFVPSKIQAHAPDQSYIYLSIYKNSMDGRFELTAKDMNTALGLNLPDRLSMEAIRPHLPQIYDYLQNRSDFSASGNTYNVVFKEPEILTLDEMEDFVRFHFDFTGVTEIPEVLDIKYDVLFDKDRKHRGMLIVEHNWKAGVLENEAIFSNIFTPNETQQELDLANNSIWKGFWLMIRLGVWHIWIGLDHILFIIALILPAVVRRREPENRLPGQKSWEWVPVDSFRQAFFYILKIVTFFTIAHSITLALASLEIINLPSNIVESIIALSIALAALHNITPIFKGKEWMIAFGFGLFHGFGFASVLGEKGLSGDFMLPSLLGFNLGVEIGQVFIICLSFPILFLIRKQRWYGKFITWGSVLLILLAMHWAIERAFEIDLRILSTVRNFLGI